MPVVSLSPIHTGMLSSVYNTFGKKESYKKYVLLKQFAKFSIKNYTVLKKYHELLLFLKAYPDNKQILDIVTTELERVIASAKKIMQGDNSKAQQSLSGSGIAGTLLIAQYSYPVTKWLIEKFPGSVYFNSASGDKEHGAEILHYLFPGIEYYYTTQGKFTLQKRVQYLSGKNKSQLQNIIKIIQQSTKDEKLCEILFDQLNIFTEWRLDSPVFNRSFIRGIANPFFYHRELVKKIDINTILSKPCPNATVLSISEKDYLLDVAKASLAFYYRETEPVTLASANDVKLFTCNRGISIALYSMKPGRRLSIESYIGYMVFKNSVPVAYGGGWMFGDRCKIGLNIYPPFRSGESALIFAEVLRLYHQFYQQQRFVIKPYQFGKGNREGLQSAAFWFYYKLGFRPVDEKIAAIAEKEFLSKQKSSLTTLKIFTQCNIQLQLKPMLQTDLDPEILSKKVTGMINEKFNGDRNKAIRTCSAFLKKILPVKNEIQDTSKYKQQLEQLSLLFSLIPDLANWNREEKKQLLKIIIAKSEDEKKYILSVQQHKKFVLALKTVAQP